MGLNERTCANHWIDHDVRHWKKLRAVHSPMALHVPHLWWLHDRGRHAVPLCVAVRPDDAWFLTMRERAIIKQRMIVHREGGDQVTFSIPQLKEAMLDPKTWLVGSFGFLVTMSGPVIIVSCACADYSYLANQT